MKVHSVVLLVVAHPPPRLHRRIERPLASWDVAMHMDPYGSVWRVAGVLLEMEATSVSRTCRENPRKQCSLVGLTGEGEGVVVVAVLHGATGMWDMNHNPCEHGTVAS